MSERTLVSVEPTMGDGVSVKLLKAAADLPNPFQPHPFKCSADAMPDWASDAAVREHGKKILRELRRHPAVALALQRALMAPDGDIHSIYFQLMDPEVESLCWEGLYDDQGRFLALDRRLAIARVAHSVVDRHLPVRAFEAPLRILAVLSALGIDAEPEWESLRSTAEKARADGLNVRLKVLTGQRSLAQTIQDAALDWVEVAATPQRTRDLEEVVSDFAPHVFHFFCHGNASHGVSWLEIGTVLDFDDQATNASFRLETRDLASLPNIDKAWLVVLNSCLGGQATEDSHSMAHKIVAQGVPAAVGMLESIDAADASVFSAAFLAAFLSLVHELVNGLDDGSEATLEWAHTLFAPRRDLSEKHDNDPANHRQWLLPVLYVRPEAFLVRHLPQNVTDESMAAMRHKVDMVAGMLRELPDDTPGLVRDRLLALLDDVPTAMRPTRFGRFDGE